MSRPLVVRKRANKRNILIASSTLVLGAAAVLSAVYASRSDIENAIALGLVNGITADNTYSKLSEYNRYNDLGEIGGFTLIGFNSINANNVTGGGILTKNLQNSININDNGSTSVSYIQNSGFPSEGSNVKSNGSMVVLGSNAVVTYDNQWYPTLHVGSAQAYSGKFIDNVTSGNDVSFSGSHIYQDLDATFIDIDAAKASAIERNTLVANNFKTDANATWSQPESWNPANLTVSGTDTAVYNLTSTCNYMPGFKVNGLNSGQTLVINIDMNGCSNWEIANVNVATNSGDLSLNSETATAPYNVLWNVYDSTSSDGLFHGNLRTQNSFGYILAPAAAIGLNNHRGTVVADSITSGNNIYRSNYLGDFIAASSPVIPVNSYSLTVHHVLRGGDLIKDTVQAVEENETYTAQHLTTAGYVFDGIKDGDKESDVMTGDREITLYYKIQNVSIAVHHQNEAGETIAPDTSVNAGYFDNIAIPVSPVAEANRYVYIRASSTISGRAGDIPSEVTLFYVPDPTTPITDENTYYNTDYWFAEQTAMGALGNFHLIGFSSIDAHVRIYGNILTKSLVNVNEFSLVDVDMINYARNINNNQIMKFAPNDNRNTVLVVGKDVPATTMDNANYWVVGGQKVDHPNRLTHKDTVWKETGDVDFLDIDALQAEAIEMSHTLASYSEDEGATVNFSNENTKTITLDYPEGLAIVNLTHADIDNSHDITVLGFERNKAATLIINVDMAGAIPNHGEYFDFAGTRIRYADGTELSPEYVQSHFDNNIVINFFDSSDHEGLYRGKVAAVRPMSAYSLIPAGEFSIQSSGYGGAIIADRITGNGNSYMLTFGKFNKIRKPPVFTFTFPTPDPDPDPDPEVPPVPNTGDNILNYVYLLVAAGLLAGISLPIAKRKEA